MVVDALVAVAASPGRIVEPAHLLFPFPWQVSVALLCVGLLILLKAPRWSCRGLPRVLCTFLAACSTLLRAALVLAAASCASLADRVLVYLASPLLGYLGPCSLAGVAPLKINGRPAQMVALPLSILGLPLRAGLATVAPCLLVRCPPGLLRVTVE